MPGGPGATWLRQGVPNYGAMPGGVGAAGMKSSGVVTGGSPGVRAAQGVYGNFQPGQQGTGGFGGAPSSFQPGQQGTGGFGGTPVATQQPGFRPGQQGTGGFGGGGQVSGGSPPPTQRPGGYGQRANTPPRTGVLPTGAAYQGRRGQLSPQGGTLGSNLMSDASRFASGAIGGASQRASGAIGGASNFASGMMRQGSQPPARAGGNTVYAGGAPRIAGNRRGTSEENRLAAGMGSALAPTTKPNAPAPLPAPGSFPRPTVAPLAGLDTGFGTPAASPNPLDKDPITGQPIASPTTAPVDAGTMTPHAKLPYDTGVSYDTFEGPVYQGTGGPAGGGSGDALSEVGPESVGGGGSYQQPRPADPMQAAEAVYTDTGEAPVYPGAGGYGGGGSGDPLGEIGSQQTGTGQPPPSPLGGPEPYPGAGTNPNYPSANGGQSGGYYPGGGYGGGGAPGGYSPTGSGSGVTLGGGGGGGSYPAGGGSSPGQSTGGTSMPYEGGGAYPTGGGTNPNYPPATQPSPGSTPTTQPYQPSPGATGSTGPAGPAGAPGAPGAAGVSPPAMTYQPPQNVGSEGYSEGYNQNQAQNVSHGESQGQQTSSGTSSGTQQAQGTSQSTGRSLSDAKQTWDVQRVGELLGPMLQREAAIANPYDRQQFSEEANRQSAQIAGQANAQVQQIIAKAKASGIDPNTSPDVQAAISNVMNQRSAAELEASSKMDAMFRQKEGEFAAGQRGQDVGQRGQDVSQRQQLAQMINALFGQQVSTSAQDAASQNTSMGQQQSQQQSQGTQSSLNDASGWSQGYGYNQSRWAPIFSMGGYY